MSTSLPDLRQPVDVVVLIRNLLGRGESADPVVNCYRALLSGKLLLSEGEKETLLRLLLLRTVLFGTAYPTMCLDSFLTSWGLNGGIAGDPSTMRPHRVKDPNMRNFGPDVEDKIFHQQHRDIKTDSSMQGNSPMNPTPTPSPSRPTFLPEDWSIGDPIPPPPLEASHGWDEAMKHHDEAAKAKILSKLKTLDPNCAHQLARNSEYLTLARSTKIDLEEFFGDPASSEAEQTDCTAGVENQRGDWFWFFHPEIEVYYNTEKNAGDVALVTYMTFVASSDKIPPFDTWRRSFVATHPNVQFQQLSEVKLFSFADAQGNVFKPSDVMKDDGEVLAFFCDPDRTTQSPSASTHFSSVSSSGIMGNDPNWDLSGTKFWESYMCRLDEPSDHPVYSGDSMGRPLCGLPELIDLERDRVKRSDGTKLAVPTQSFISSPNSKRGGGKSTVGRGKTLESFWKRRKTPSAGDKPVGNDDGNDNGDGDDTLPLDVDLEEYRKMSKTGGIRLDDFKDLVNETRDPHTSRIKSRFLPNLGSLTRLCAPCGTTLYINFPKLWSGLSKSEKDKLKRCAGGNIKISNIQPKFRSFRVYISSSFVPYCYRDHEDVSQTAEMSKQVHDYVRALKFAESGKDPRLLTEDEITRGRIMGLCLNTPTFDGVRRSDLAKLCSAKTVIKISTRDDDNLDDKDDEEDETPAEAQANVERRETKRKRPQSNSPKKKRSAGAGKSSDANTGRGKRRKPASSAHIKNNKRLDLYFQRSSGVPGVLPLKSEPKKENDVAVKKEFH